MKYSIWCYLIGHIWQRVADIKEMGSRRYEVVEPADNCWRCGWGKTEDAKLEQFKMRLCQHIKEQQKNGYEADTILTSVKNKLR